MFILIEHDQKILILDILFKENIWYLFYLTEKIDQSFQAGGWVFQYKPPLTPPIYIYIYNLRVTTTYIDDHILIYIKTYTYTELYIYIYIYSGEYLWTSVVNIKYLTYILLFENPCNNFQSSNKEIVLSLYT